MSYIDDLEREGICPDCGCSEECQCAPIIDDEPYPGLLLDEGEEEKR